MQYKQKPIRRADEEDEDEEKALSGFQVKATPLATSYRATIDEPFTHVKQFENIVACLEKCVQGDVMEIKLSTPGGYIHAVLPLLSAIAGTQAQVFVHAVSDVASAGTFLLMMADDVFINPYATIMLHQVQHGAAGQGNHVEDRVNYVSRTSKQLMSELYHDFLSPEEIQALLTGKEFWMDKAEFDKRYAARIEKRDAFMAAALQAAEAQLEAEKKPKRPRRKKQENNE